MKVPSQLRIRVLSWLSVAVLTAASLVTLTYVLPARGLAQLAPRNVEVVGQGTAEFHKGQTSVAGCSFDVAAQDQEPPTGRFTCLMSDQAIALGFPFTQLTAAVTGFGPVTQHEATLSGSSTLQLPDGTEQDAVAFVLRLVAGGPGEGSLRIRLLGVFDGAPGDAKAGNGDYDQWWQFLTDGSIQIQPAPSPSPSPSETPSPSPSGSPSPSPSPSSTPSPTPSVSSSPPPSPTPTVSASPPAPASSIPPVRDAPVPATGANSTARMMALLAQASADGTPKLADILSVVGPFPVAGLTWWMDDWHAYRCCPYPHLHQGLDMFASAGTPVVAASDGYVSQKVDNPISGLGVEITDAGNTQYFYAHLSRFAEGLAVGERVHLGDVIGYVGNTGNAIRTSPHLHFEVQPNGVPVPPKPLVDRWLVAAEQQAEAMVAARTGHAVLNPADLDRWLALARSLEPQDVGGEGGAGGPPDGERVLVSVRTTPRGPAPGAMIAFASALLLMLLVAPACVMGRREAQRTGWATGGSAFDRPSPSSPPPEPDPPSA
jgi:murein DD-endopeptidase MepM/ murein hydrolase activator NlpD